MLSSTPRTPFSGLTPATGGVSEAVPSPHLRSVIQQKERELSHLNEQRVITLEGRIRDLEATLASRDTELERWKIQMTDIERDFNYNLKLIGERDREIQRLERDFAEAKRGLTESDLIKARALARAEELESQSADLSTRLRREMSELQERAVREIEQRRAEAAEEVARVRAELSRDFASRLEIARGSEAEARARLELFGQENGKLQKRVAELELDLDRAVGQFEESVASLRGAQKSLQGLEGEHDRLKKDHTRVTELLDRTRSEAVQSERKLDDENMSLRKENDLLKADLEDARRRVDRLEAALRESDRTNAANRDELRRVTEASEEESRLHARTIDTLRRQLDEGRARGSDVESQVEAQRAQLADMERGLVERSREAAAAAARANKAEEQVSHLLRQVEELGNQLHIRTIEEEQKAQGNWERYVMILTDDRDRALEDGRTARRRADEAESEVQGLRQRLRRAEDTIEYLRGGSRTRTGTEEPRSDARDARDAGGVRDAPPSTYIGGPSQNPPAALRYSSPSRREPLALTAGPAASATAPAYSAAHGGYSSTLAAPAQLPTPYTGAGASLAVAPSAPRTLHLDLPTPAAPPSLPAPTPAAPPAATPAAALRSPAASAPAPGGGGGEAPPGGAGSVRGAVDRFARRLEDLAYENSKLKYKVSDLKSRIHDSVERKSLPPRGPANHYGDTLMGYAEAVLDKHGTSRYTGRDVIGGGSATAGVGSGSAVYDTAAGRSHSLSPRGRSSLLASGAGAAPYYGAGSGGGGGGYTGGSGLGYSGGGSGGRGGAGAAGGGSAPDLSRPVDIQPPRPLYQLGPGRSGPPPETSISIPPAPTSDPPRIEVDISNTVPSFTDRGPNPRLDRAKDLILSAKAQLEGIQLPVEQPVTRFPDSARFDPSPEVAANRLRTSKLDSLKALLRNTRETGA